MIPQNDRAARLAYTILSNLMLCYGIQFLGWKFFPVLYLFWWEELVTTFFASKKLRRLRPLLLEKETETDVLAREGGVMVRYFFLFVWLVFVVALGAFAMAPSGDWLANLRILLLQDRLFDLNLLGFVGLQILSFWPRFLKKNNPTASPEEVAALGESMGRRGLVIHVGILAGAFAGMFWHRDWFKWGFLAVKVAADAGAIFWGKPARKPVG